MSKSMFTEMRECLICAESKPATLKFPSFSTCNHDAHACTDCYAQQAIVLVKQHRRWDAVTCPACNIKLPKAKLELLLPRDEFTRLDNIVKKAALVEHVNWRWCLAPGCGHGQTHNVPKSSLQAVKCSKCSAVSCFQHHVKWHVDYTCQQYDAHHPDSAITKTNKEVIRTTTKACPHCEWRIQKNGGCSHMECPNCRRSFFWDRLAFDGEDRPSAAEYAGGPENSRGLFPVLDADVQDAILEMEGLGGNQWGGPRLPQRPTQQQRRPGGFGITYERHRAGQGTLRLLSLQETMNHRRRGGVDLSPAGGSPMVQEAPAARQFSLQRSPRHNDLAGDLEDAIERAENVLRHVDPSRSDTRERSLAYRRADGSGTPVQASLTADIIRDHHSRAFPQPRTLITRLRSTSAATYNTLFHRPSVVTMRFEDDPDRLITEQLDAGRLALFRDARIRGQEVSTTAGDRQVRHSVDNHAVRLQVEQDRQLAMQMLEQENQEWGVRRRADPPALGTQYQSRATQLTRAEATRRNDESRRLTMAQPEEMRRSNSNTSEGPWVNFSDDDDDYGYLPDEEDDDDDEPVLPRGWMVPAPEPGRSTSRGFF